MSALSVPVVKKVLNTMDGKKVTCSICHIKEPMICCASCEALYCGNCNVAFHDETCPTRIRKLQAASHRSQKGTNFGSNGHNVFKPIWLETKKLDNKTNGNRKLIDVELLEKDINDISISSHQSDMNDILTNQRPNMNYNKTKYSPTAAQRDNDKGKFDNYSYATIEFRPMKVTEDGAMSTSVESNSSSNNEAPDVRDADNANKVGVDRYESKHLYDMPESDADDVNKVGVDRYESKHLYDMPESDADDVNKVGVDRYESKHLYDMPESDGDFCETPGTVITPGNVDNHDGHTEPYAIVDCSNQADSYSEQHGENYQWEPPTQREGSEEICDEVGSTVQVGTPRNGSEEVYDEVAASGHPIRQRDDSTEFYDEVAPKGLSSGTNIADLYAKVDYSKKKTKSRKELGKVSNSKREESVEPYYYSIIPDGDSDGETELDSTKVGKSEFFVDIPEKRGDTPPPAPEPYAASKVEKKNASKGLRKQSAPAIIIQKDSPRTASRVRERLGEPEKKHSSSDDLVGDYCTVDDKFELDRNSTKSSSSKSSKGHRRNNSYDWDMRGQRSSSEVIHVSDRDIALFTKLSKPDENSLKKQHRRMRSHENVTKIFSSPSVKDNKMDLADFSPDSGKSSAESSSDSPKSNKSPDDSGENLYADVPDVDMKELLRKAEELVSEELPEGWQEVRDGNEVYYWHIWTGTIQYERPVLTPTPSSSSRSLSPLNSGADSGSSKSTSVSDIHERASQVKSPQQTSRPDTPPVQPKQVISFPVHSMGWMDVPEDKMGSGQLGDTVLYCISSLAEQRKDLWQIADTWGEGRDIKLLLEGQILKLVEPKSKKVLLQQQIVKMRIWGAGKEDRRDFAYIARDKKTGRHRCHMFRCHGNVSGRTITNALRAVCNRILDEKRKAKERSASPSAKSGSDLLNAPLTTSARVGTSFNEKPFIEQKKSFSAKYVGWTEVSKSSGIDQLNKAVSKLSAKPEEDWKTVLIEVTTSEVRTIDCLTQGIIMEDRVRFVSFLGVAKDERMCGYIVAAGLDMFVCHVYYCTPHGGALTKAIEEACRLRFEKVLDKHAAEGLQSPDQNQQPIQQRSIVKEKGMALKSSMQGLFNKLQKRDSRKKDDGPQTNPDRRSPPLQPDSPEYMIKYFGYVPVSIGTGIDTVQDAVEQLSGGSMMVGYLEVTETGVTLYDSQKTALSRRVVDLDTVSFCGMTSDRKHFGLIVTQGGGKYVCHVFQEYKTSVGSIVSAIQEVL